MIIFVTTLTWYWDEAELCMIIYKISIEIKCFIFINDSKKLRENWIRKYIIWKLLRTLNREGLNFFWRKYVWKEIFLNVLVNLNDLLFSDTTLSCEDGKNMEAHKIIISISRLDQIISMKDTLEGGEKRERMGSLSDCLCFCN